MGGVSLALLLVWALTLTLAARTKRVFSFSQSVMLVTWPCWPAIPGLGIALVAATDPPVSAGILGLTLLIGGGLSIVGVSVRVLRDYWDVSGLAFPWVLLLTLPSPLVIAGSVCTWLTIEYDIPLRLLWHLLSRT